MAKIPRCSTIFAPPRGVKGMKTPKPVKPKCPDCGGSLLLHYPDKFPYIGLLCKSCKAKFKIKAWWPVPGKKIK